MFINNTEFKRTLNNSYKADGIKIARACSEAASAGMLMLAGADWIINMNEAYIPNKTKGILFEILGGLPLDGQCLEMHAGREMQPITMPAWMDLYGMQNRYTQKYVTTKMSYGINGMLQQPDSGKIYLVDGSRLNLIGRRELNLDIETSPEGPFAMNEVDGYTGFLWYNNICAISVQNIRVDNPDVQTVVEALEKVELAG